MLRKFAVAACLSLGTLAYGSAGAAVLACPANISTLVTGSAACQYTLDAANDDTSSVPFTVNQEAFFSFTDWQFDSRIFDSPSGAGGQAGSWDINSIFNSAWTDVMLIFKGGADETLGINGLAGYLLNDGVLSGTWESPFRNPPFTDLAPGQTSNTLHISVYFRSDDREVAEPTTLALLAFGLVGLGIARRRGARD
jgi:hypothetical protein